MIGLLGQVVPLAVVLVSACSQGAEHVCQNNMEGTKCAIWEQTIQTPNNVTMTHAHQVVE